jgi:hypothetical protein
MVPPGLVSGWSVNSSTAQEVAMSGDIVDKGEAQHDLDPMRRDSETEPPAGEGEHVLDVRWSFSITSRCLDNRSGLCFVLELPVSPGAGSA